jgi:multidrug efflux pump subunit AcrA (membrane-fusion protein)
VDLANLDSVLGWMRKHVWSLAILIGLLIVSAWAVRHFKRPGQMTVLESQAMDMSAMKPPVGSVPVATEIVHGRPFSAKVRYTGSVAAYTEQNVYPRVEGWLTDLKTYNGDKVRADQLLALLDSPDIRSRLSEATYGHIAAAREVPVAKSNLTRMRAEFDAARREIQAAGQEVKAARAGVEAATQMASQAEKEVKSAQASLDYWRAEFKRQANLLKEGAVSQQEYDSERAQMIAAEADFESKRAKVKEAKANVQAAKAELSGKESQVQIAKDMALAARAALSGASGEVSQKAASAEMARAARDTAAAFDKYRQIRAPLAGVVTKRYLSPGVLVSPGMAILNIAQIDRVRLQANVAEKDLGSIRIGAEVIAHTVKGQARTIRAVVTSISPLADQTSRTAVVEAVVPNPGHQLWPGDFVSMEIATSSSTDAITVPNSALTTKDGQDAVWAARCTTVSGKTTYYCTMDPEVESDKPGLCPKCKMGLVPKEATTGKTAHLVSVTIGSTDGERTEILSGLSEGDEIIYAGNRYLREGDAITPTKWGESGPEQLPAPPGGSKGTQMPGMDGGNDSMPGMKM